MASMVHERIGKCAICKDNYKDPKMLPCVHTFCKDCLIESLRSAHRHSERFCCPVCENPQYLSKSTIKALPSNFLLDNISYDPFESQNEWKGDDTVYDFIPSVTEQSDDATMLGVCPIPVKRGVAKPQGEKRKGVCLRHPNGSVYCKTCNVYQCLMCRNNKEHRNHDLEEVSGVVKPGTEKVGLYKQKTEGGNSSIDANFMELLQQNHQSGHTVELCKMAMTSVRSEATTLEMTIKKCADEAMKKIEEEKLMLLKTLTQAEATKLQTIRRALQSANQLTHSQSQRVPNNKKQLRRPISQIVLPDIPKEDNVSFDKGIKRNKNIQLENSLKCLGITFAPRDHEGSFLLGELKEIHDANCKTDVQVRQKMRETAGHVSDRHNTMVKLRDSKMPKNDNNADQTNEQTLKVIARKSTFSEAQPTTNKLELFTSSDNTCGLSSNHDNEQDWTDTNEHINTSDISAPSDITSDHIHDDRLLPVRRQPTESVSRQPQPAHRPLRRLHQRNPPQKPIPATRTILPRSALESNTHDQMDYE